MAGVSKRAEFEKAMASYDQARSRVSMDVIWSVHQKMGLVGFWREDPTARRQIFSFSTSV